ncbi:MAG: SUMF1/EgtB/PvdO family nonheme iron enzyme [Alphaproteobacteria bacterium]|jgi:iron(II)-dependent oxidoreductase|nr:SUMF1/EgtB/PvdO family nonheme iron enzyme [Alphaproteobacteria bacterium]
MTANPIAEAVPMFASPSIKATTIPRILAFVVLSATTAFAPWLIRPDTAIAQAPPDMVRITGGAFTMGRDGGNADERPAHGVTLDPFLIDIYEVTNAQFAAFLNTLEVTAKRDVRAGELRPDDVEGPDADRLWGGSSGNDRAFIEMDDTDARIGIVEGRFSPEPGFADHPVSESTWQGAVAFCAWRGARLPTEAEWEAAARGKDGRTYPWGEAPPTPEHAVFGRGRGETDPVGSHRKGATPEGVFDLSGNEAEWTSSLLMPYPYNAADGREDPKALGERVTRGGDHVFDVAPDQLTGTFRDGFSRDPRRGHRHIGFRCAKDAG